MSDEPKLLNKQDAATYIGVSVRTLQRLTKRGEIPKATQPGPKGDELRFSTADLDRYLERHKPHALIRPMTPDTTNDTALVMREQMGEVGAQIASHLLILQDRLLTRKQASEEFGLSLAVISRAIKARELPVYAGGRHGSKVIKRSDLIRYISTLRPLS